MLDLVVGAEVTLNCSASGSPPPVYSWLSAHTLQDTLTEEAVLTSSTLLPGTYTCTASNRLGSKSKRFLLKARSKGRRRGQIKSDFIYKAISVQSGNSLNSKLRSEIAVKK